MKKNKLLSKLKNKIHTMEITPEKILNFPFLDSGKLISIEEFSKLEPTDIEIFVVKPVKKIVSILSHVVILIVHNNVYF